MQQHMGAAQPQDGQEPDDDNQQGA
jgi:hypothetical protein